MMNQTEETKLLEQIEEWNDADEFSRCIEAIEAIPEQERDYLLTVKLSRAYSNLAVLGDHGEHGTDSEVDGNLIQHAIRLLESVRTQGENDPYWNARMGYSCLMAWEIPWNWIGMSGRRLSGGRPFPLPTMTSSAM